VEQEAERIGLSTWSSFGRDAGIKVIRLTFVRMCTAHEGPLTHTVPAQLMSGEFTREELESRHLTFRSAIVLREGGTWGPETKAAMGRLMLEGSGSTDPNGPATGRTALTDAIQHALGEHMSEVRLRGQDTIDVRFSNPPFWQPGDTAKSLPEESLPIAREAAKRGALYIWDHHAKNAGINVIRITFHRDWRERTPSTWLQHPAQDLIAQFTRQQLETRQLDPVQFKIIER